MLRRLRDLENWTIEAADGQEVGPVEDFYFDDSQWTVRYAVANAGGWLTGRTVLISPISFKTVDWDRARICIDLSRDAVTNAPPVDTGRPITRRYEAAYASYYSYPPYWAGPHNRGPAATPDALAGSSPGSEPIPVGDEGDPERTHLHSASEVAGYHISALDGDVGHVEDYIADDESWRIRYLIVDTSNWIGGRNVLVSPDWVRRVDWTGQAIHVDTTRDSVRSSPEYDQSAGFGRPAGRKR